MSLLFLYNGGGFSAVPSPLRTYCVEIDSRAPRHYAHAVGATLDYTFDWTAWVPEGDSIASLVVSCPLGFIAARVQAGDLMTAVVSVPGVAAGTEVALVCVATSTVGRIDRREILLEVLDL